MKKIIRYYSLTAVLVLCGCFPEQDAKPVKTTPTRDIYGTLFHDVQSRGIFADSKTFVDCIPLMAPDSIVREYEKQEPESDSAIRAFVLKHFILPENYNAYVTDSSEIGEHIKNLWEVLTRQPDTIVKGTLIPLPFPYVVPGGRFREIYYWDSYFTMLGLVSDGELQKAKWMVDNFAWLIRKYGFIPNGNRTYYLSRSQPPFFSMMVSLLAEHEGDSVYVAYLDELVKEHAFWMDGSDKMSNAPSAYRRLVKLETGPLLNRYWDDKNFPRPESYREDMATVKEAALRRPLVVKEDIYRDIRAAAESGWDFSSRWLEPDKQGHYHLYSIRTTKIIPVDLNALICQLEKVISKAYKVSGDSLRSESFLKMAAAREQEIQNRFWSDSSSFFMDYDLPKGMLNKNYSLAGLYPLFFRQATYEQAEKVSAKVRELFLRDGGVVTTLYNSGQQWDAPNGWAPLQFITVRGLRNYGHKSLADSIAARWLELNRKTYRATYKMLEKYNVSDTTQESGGGEYPTQDGFGWTNGVYKKLSAMEEKKPIPEKRRKKGKAMHQ